MPDAITFKGYIVIQDIKPPKENCTCYDCEKGERCDLYEKLNESSKHLYKPCLWFGGDRFEPKQ